MSSQLTAVIVPAFIPSPGQGVWHLGPVPLRAYAICILLGIFAGYWLGRQRWVARGGSAEVIADVVMWAVPFGLVGARVYHVITDADLYFGEGRNPVDALKIWNGGLGIWGAVAFGALGAWIACRRHQVPFLAVADALAPGVALAQVIGRFGNYFNQELFGRPTTRAWGLEIDPAYRPDGYAQFATFHPTFLYEALWNLGVIALVILAGRRFQLGHGRTFALYVAGYTVGRAWIENLRIDTVNQVGGLRLNVWTSIVLFVLAVVFLLVSARLKPGQEDLRAPAAGTSTSTDDRAGTSASTDDRTSDGASASDGTSTSTSASDGISASADDRDRDRADDRDGDNGSEGTGADDRHRDREDTSAADHTSDGVSVSADDRDGDSASEDTSASDRTTASDGTSASDRDGASADDRDRTSTSADDRHRASTSTGADDRGGASASDGTSASADDRASDGASASASDRDRDGASADDRHRASTSADDRDGASASEGTGEGADDRDRTSDGASASDGTSTSTSTSASDGISASADDRDGTSASDGDSGIAPRTAGRRRFRPGSA